MDKETLSNYGWIVICVMVLAVMIALATPFGEYIKNATKNTLFGLINTSDSAMNVIIYDNKTIEPKFLDIIEYGDYMFSYIHCNSLDEYRDGFLKSNAHLINCQFETEKQESPNIGCRYASWNATRQERLELCISYDLKCTWDEFLANGYTEYDYFEMCNVNETWERYKQASAEFEANGIPTKGWESNASFMDKTKTSYDDIPTEFYGEPILSVNDLFSYCTKLEISPVIPETVISMRGTYSGCSSLITAPTIPETVIFMDGTFKDCTSLTGTIRIPCHITDEDVNSWYNCTATVERYCYENCSHEQ